jgi:hypothetical protein
MAAQNSIFQPCDVLYAVPKLNSMFFSKRRNDYG